MKPLSNRVFIKQITKEQKSASGLILPKREDELQYQVIEVGAKCKALTKGRILTLYEHADKTPYLDGFFIHETMGIKSVM